MEFNFFFLTMYSAFDKTSVTDFLTQIYNILLNSRCIQQWSEFDGNSHYLFNKFKRKHNSELDKSQVFRCLYSKRSEKKNVLDSFVAFWERKKAISMK